MPDVPDKLHVKDTLTHSNANPYSSTYEKSAFVILDV